MMETGETIYEKVYASPRPPPKISFKDNWMKELGSEVAGGSEYSQQTQPKSKTQLFSTGRLVKSEQPSGSLTQEIEKGVLLGCESTNVSTGRPVKSGQSIGLFTQREEIDTDIRVSGLPRAVVKQAENPRVRELVKKIESHPHREALQADLQQSNFHNPFSDDSKAMIREMSNVELFELCETIPKCNAQNAFFIGIKEWSVALEDISWLKANPVKILVNGDWMLSPSRTTSSRRGDPMVLGTAKPTHRKSISENLRSIKNTGNNLTMKQMFNISEKLIVGQSDEIYGVTPINWEDSSWKQLSFWLVMKQSLVTRTRRFTYFQILCHASE